MPLFSVKNQKHYKRTFYRVAIEGKQVICPFCGNDSFESRYEQLNMPLNNAIGIQVANPLCTSLICQKCGHIERFFNDAEKLSGPL